MECYVIKGYSSIRTNSTDFTMVHFIVVRIKARVIVMDQKIRSIASRSITKIISIIPLNPNGALLHLAHRKTTRIVKDFPFLFLLPFISIPFFYFGRNNIFTSVPFHFWAACFLFYRSMNFTNPGKQDIFLE